MPSNEAKAFCEKPVLAKATPSRRHTSPAARRSIVCDRVDKTPRPTEEVPPAARGRALSAMLLFSPARAVVAGALVAAGLLHNPLAWRAFFLIAAIPLLVVAVGWRRLGESRAFVPPALSPLPPVASEGQEGHNFLMFGGPEDLPRPLTPVRLPPCAEG